MTKADIINKIAMSTGLQKKDVAVVVESFMESIKSSLLEDKENVYLRGFGSFVIKHRAAKTARNILQKTTMIIEAHDLPSFKPAKCFVDQMKEGKKKNCTYNLISVNQVSQEQNIITHNNHFNKLKLCQTERKKRDTRWLRTSVKKD